MLPYVTWKHFYSVGDPFLDAEHKQILGIINELYDAVAQGQDHALRKPVLSTLLQYTLAHFKHEEQAMADHEYPDFARHKAAHDKLRRRTRDFVDNVDLLTGRDLLRFLKDWWLGHIQEMDKQYQPYMELTSSRR